jgi:hypothetical protein
MYYLTKIGTHFAYNIQKFPRTVAKSVAKRLERHGEGFEEGIDCG